MNRRSGARRPAGRGQRAWPFALPAVLLLASCTTVVAGTPQTAAGAVVERPLSVADRLALADAVIGAHAALSSMTRSTVHRDPVSTDVFSTREVLRGGMVDRVVTFDPTSPEVWWIEEVRCVDQRAYATPVPSDVEVDATWLEVPIDPAETDSDVAHFVGYVCDYGYPQDLSYDVTFLDETQSILDLGPGTADGVPVERYRVELDATDAAGVLVGASWLFDGTLVRDAEPTVRVEIAVDDQDRVRALDSAIRADGRDYGDALVLGGFDEIDATVQAPDPADVGTG